MIGDEARKIEREAREAKAIATPDRRAAPPHPYTAASAWRRCVAVLSALRMPQSENCDATICRPTWRTVAAYGGRTWRAITSIGQ
jgi:hypothetical protein